MRKSVVDVLVEGLQVRDEPKPQDTNGERYDELWGGAGAEKDECAREDHLAHRAAELEPPVLRLVLVVH